MKIHEYQAKAILARYGVTTPRGEVAFTKEEALQAAQRLKSNICVVKAQIHAGGRGRRLHGDLRRRQETSLGTRAPDDSSSCRLAGLPGLQDSYGPRLASRSRQVRYAFSASASSSLHRH